MFPDIDSQEHQITATRSSIENENRKFVTDEFKMQEVYLVLFLLLSRCIGLQQFSY